MDSQQTIDFWIQSSDQDFKTMVDLFQTHNYHWSLFMGHLVIEKLLKALYVKKVGDYPPRIHDLRRLAELCSLLVSNEQIVTLDSITRFNINARYDDYKQNFYKICNQNFTTEWINKIEVTRAWIKQLL